MCTAGSVNARKHTGSSLTLPGHTPVPWSDSCRTLNSPLTAGSMSQGVATRRHSALSPYILSFKTLTELLVQLVALYEWHTVGRNRLGLASAERGIGGRRSLTPMTSAPRNRRARGRPNDSKGCPPLHQHKAGAGSRAGVWPPQHWIEVPCVPSSFHNTPRNVTRLGQYT